MAGTRRGKAADLVFQGVVIPGRTRSAKIAAQGIRNEEDMGKFLTAVFSDTLNGKIVLPKPGSAASSLNGAEHELKRGFPMMIQEAKAKPKKKRSLKSTN